MDNRGFARTFLHAGLKLGSANTAVTAAAFARSVIFARLLLPADYGIGALLTGTFAAIELLSYLALEKLIIQSDRGEEIHYQGMIHCVQVIRGAVNSTVIFFAATPLARLFDIPQATWAFQAMAIVALMRGLSHSDTCRLQRNLKYEAVIKSEIVTAVMLTLLALPISLYFRNYAAVLWVLVTQATLSTVTSHIFASRPYRWNWDSKLLPEVVTFGWPLMVNGVLMFLILEGERFAIGSAKQLFHTAAYDLNTLGAFSVASSAVGGVGMFLSSVLASLFLPTLSRSKAISAELAIRYVGCCLISTLLATSCFIVFIALGPMLVGLVYGRHYVDVASEVMGWLAGAWAIRSIRQAPTCAAMALGDTQNAMVANLFRSTAFGGALFIAASGGGLAWIAATGFAGEVIALTVSVARLHRKQGLSSMLIAKPVVIAFLTILSTVLASALLGVANQNWFVATALVLVAVVTLYLSMLSAYPDFRRALLKGAFQRSPG